MSNAVNDETFTQRLRSIFSYVEYELLGSIANALIIGLVIAGMISAYIPDGFFERHLGSHFMSMVLMLIAGIPMYVCASASTPIAASLIMKGISPGAALVFLLTGPATNAITVSTVIKSVGKKAAFIYLAAIAAVSLALGQLLNVLAATYGFNSIILVHQHEILPEWLKMGGTIVMSLMLVWYYLNIKVLRRLNRKKNMSHQIMLNVQGMTCMHCAGNVQKAIESVSGTSNVSVDLDGNKVFFDMEEKNGLEKVKAAITSAGYQV
jgi:copper chaperone CopZ